MLHCFVLSLEDKERRLESLRVSGIVWPPGEQLVVMHAESNALDCNSESLLYGPHSLNMQMIQSQPKESHGRFIGRATETLLGRDSVFKEANRRLSTRTLSDREETLHAMDCLKMHILVRQNERGRAQFLLQYALHRPPGYAQFYNVDTLAMRFEALYQPKVVPVCVKKAFVQNCHIVPVTAASAQRLNQLISERRQLCHLPDGWSPLSLSVVNTLVQSQQPFEVSRDVVYEYRGSHGLSFSGVIWRRHFDRFLLGNSLHLKDGYPAIGPNRLHRLVCWAEGLDILHRKVQHSFDARLDSRASSLKPDEGANDGSNPRTVARKTAQSSSVYPGVTKVRGRNRWFVRIRFCYRSVFLGSFADERAASLCYQHAFDRQLETQRMVRGLIERGASRFEISQAVRTAGG